MFSCCTRQEAWDPDSFYHIRPECREDVPKTHFKPLAGRTLSARRWHACFSEDGHLDIATVISRIQRGGIHPTIKGAVWEFLLGCYGPDSTFDERTELRQRRRSEYNTLKSKCNEMEPTVGSGRLITAAIITEDGHPVEVPSTNGDEAGKRNNDNVVKDKDVIEWKLTLHQIGLDVVRTDRTLLYYENGENQARLWDILAVYSWVDRDIGYCQGMSDLCSPISILVENEADAFWCFERLMRRMRANFKCTSSTIGVRSQLTVLSSVMKSVDPKLHDHIDNLDGGDYLFAFRMLMVLFRREFSFVDTMYLWEMMWAMEYNPKLFSLYESDAAVDDNAGSDAAAPAAIGPMLKKYGKFERKNVRVGQLRKPVQQDQQDQQPPLSIFLVASILEAQNKKLLQEAKGLDDLVEILNDITGSLDARKACNNALKLHSKYLKVKVA